MITLKNISKSYTSRGEKVTLFTGLDWHINAGSFVALMGASGTGKSTLLSLVAGIISPESGSIVLGDLDITTLGRDAIIEYRGQQV